MPWSGGVYTRGYPSWTNDANNNLPISATKFDLEDNDFATGLNNCLTIDGTNKPNATLTWPQIIALTRASDGTFFSLSRTGGSNNPSLTWNNNNGANTIYANLNTGNTAISFAPTAYQFGNITDNPTFTFLGTGTVTIGGPIVFNFPTANPTSTILLSSNGPNADFNDTSQTANNKRWRLGASTAQYALQTLDDAVTSGHAAWTATRSGNTVASLILGNQTDNAPVQYAIAGANREIGFRSAEINSQAGAYSLIQSDNGRIVEMPNASTVTAPVLTQGSIITLVNGSSSSSLTITGSGVTLRLGNSGGTTGNRTLAPWASCLVYYTSSSTAYVFGGGVT